MELMTQAKTLKVHFGAADKAGITAFVEKVLSARIVAEQDKEVQALVFSFEEATFLFRPYHLVTLACFAEELHKAGKKFSFEAVADSECEQWIEALRLREYWQAGFDREKPTRISSENTTYLWKIAAAHMTQYADQIEGLIDERLGFTKDLIPFRTSLAELFNNVLDHSKSLSSGYALCQYYQSEQKLCLSVCDFGLGIPTTLNDYWESIGKVRKADPEALAHAVEKGVTSKSTPKNKGYGLFNIKTLTGENSGSCLILSNFASLYSKQDGQLRTYPLQFEFPGTLVYIEIPTADLPQKEQEIADEFEY